MSHLKLALHTTTTNEWSEAPDYAYLEISVPQAQALVYLMSLTQQFRGQMDRSGLVDPCYDISLGLGKRLPNFRLISIPFADEQEPQRDRPIVRLPEGFDPEPISALAGSSRNSVGSGPVSDWTDSKIISGFAMQNEVTEERDEMTTG